MTATLDEAHALTHAGSLLSAEGDIVAPYDLEVTGDAERGFQPLPVLNANDALFRLDYACAREVHLITAFGVTLGDSIIGLTALVAIAQRHPHLAFTIHRPAHAPRYVQRLYELAAPSIGRIAALPAPLASLPQDALAIDIGNHLFWPRFASMPMIDFFLDAMGVAPEEIHADRKRNRWLAGLPLPAPASRNQRYVLFCPSASTPIRSIAPRVHAVIVGRLVEAFGLPVFGFGAVDHLGYTDISPRSRSTDEFLAWIAHARHVVTTDSSPLHAAAGFDVPTTAFFTTIAARLRARDYARCVAVEFDLPHLKGMHASARESDLADVERACQHARAIVRLKRGQTGCTASRPNR